MIVVVTHSDLDSAEKTQIRLAAVVDFGVDPVGGLVRLVSSGTIIELEGFTAD